MFPSTHLPLFLDGVGLNVRLGCQVPRVPVKALHLSHYLKAESLPPAPAIVDYYSNVAKWPMYANDRIGCCAIAAPAHMIQSWTQYDTSKPILFTDDQIVKAYSDVSGYDPRTGANDNGCFLSDVLSYWSSTGIGGRKIFGHVAVDPRDVAITKIGAYIFGGLDLGINMPAGWQRNTGPGRVWDANQGSPGGWGGHSVNVVGYDDRYLYVVTWGFVQRLTWAGFRQYTFESYATISQDWLNEDRKAPNGIDMASMIDDLKAMGGKVGPSPYPPEPEPQPEPGPQPPKPEPREWLNIDIPAGAKKLKLAFAT